jgi:hypothetical protein
MSPQFGSFSTPEQWVKPSARPASRGTGSERLGALMIVDDRSQSSRTVAMSSSVRWRRRAGWNRNDPALGRFRRRPPMSALPTGLQRDIPEFFGRDADGCRRADEPLFRAGDAGAVDDTGRRSAVGEVLSFGERSRSLSAGRGERSPSLAAGRGKTGDGSSPNPDPRSASPARRSGPDCSTTPRRSAPGPVGRTGCGRGVTPFADLGWCGILGCERRIGPAGVERPPGRLHGRKGPRY